MDPLIDRLLEIEKMDLSQFKTVLSNDEAKIYKQQEDGDPVVLLRTDFVIEYPASIIYTLLCDLNERSKWDTVFTSMKVLKIINDNTDIAYMYLKAPLMVSDRDFVSKRVIFKNFLDIDYCVALTNYESEEFPPKKKVIRAETIISGYILRKITEDKTRLCTFSKTDIKGSIPKYLINKLGQKAPLNWLKKFKKALSKYTKEHNTN